MSSSHKHSAIWPCMSVWVLLSVCVCIRGMRDPGRSALQVGVGVTHLMTTATYVHLVHTSRVQRRSRRARLQLDASATAAASGAPADVASSAAAAAAAPPIPHAAVAAPPFDPTMPALHLPDEPADGGDVAGRTPRDSAGPVRGWVATGGPGPVGEAAESKAARAPDYGDRGTDRVDAAPGEESISATPGAAGVRAGPPLRPRPVGGSNGELPFVSESNSELASDLEGGDELGSALPATAEELEERMLEAKRLRSWAGAAGHLLWKVWDGVREEPRVGFRCVLRCVLRAAPLHALHPRFRIHGRSTRDISPRVGSSFQR